MININNFIGVDVSKDKIDIYISILNKYKTIANDHLEKEINDIKNKLLLLNGNLDNTLVIIDLTGGYEVLCRDIFYNIGFKNILLAEGLKIKNFSRTKLNNRAKTDKLDAKLLSDYGKFIFNNLVTNNKYYNNYYNKTAKFYNKEEYDKRNILNKYMGRIIDFKELKQKNRLKTPNIPKDILLSIERNINFIEEEIDILRNKINAIIKSDNEFNIIYNFLLSQKGIGIEITQLLISLLPELGKVNRRQIASITGTAPIVKDSGTISKHRFTNKGRSIIKKTLFLSIISKLRYDKELKNKYEQLQLKGKSKMVAIVALMRRFVVELNAKIKNELLFNVTAITNNTNITVDDTIDYYC